MMRTLVISCVFFFVTLSTVAQCCSGGVPMSGSLGLSAGEAKTLQLLATYDYNVLDRLFEGNRQLDDRTRKRTTHSALIETNYNFSKRFSFSALFSVVRQERLVKTLPVASSFNATTGIGDAVALAKFNILVPSLKQPYRLSVGAGPKIPLGRTDFRTKNGIILPADMQPGSGAWDAMLWSYFERYHLLIKNLTFTTIATYRHTGNNDQYFGDQVYQFGNEAVVNTRLSYQWLMKKQLVSALAGLRFRNQQDDQINGEFFPNSGGTFLFASAGFRVNFNNEHALMINGFIPVLRNVGGTQVTTTGRIQLSYFKEFKLNNNKNKKVDDENE